MRLFVSLCTLCLLLSMMAGCASIVSDNNSATYIETTPENSRCTLHGQDFKRTVNTPNSIQLPANAAPITIACESDGYHTTSAVLDTNMDGWIIGNLIFGGIIGAAIDAGRGAGMKYPPRFFVQLDPMSFETAQERDDYYASRKGEIEKQYVAERKKVTRRFKDKGDKTVRERMLKTLDDEETRELERLERNRVTSIISATMYKDNDSAGLDPVAEPSS